MSLNISFHFNFSYFLEPIPKDEENIHSQLLYWLMTNSPLRGTISFNSLFLDSAIWDNEGFIKNVSKLALNNQIELGASLFSSCLDTSFLNHNILEKSVEYALKKLKSIYPPHYIKGFYPPFGNFSTRLSRLVEKKEEIEYLIVNWRILFKTLKLKEMKDLPNILAPYKLKDHNLVILPSINLGDIQYMFPEIHKRYLKTGDITELFEILQRGLEHSKKTGEEYSTILTIDLNDTRIPRYIIRYEIYKILKDSIKIMELPLRILKPSQILERYANDRLPEIELKNTISAPLMYVMPEENCLAKDPLCNKLHSEYNECINELVKITQIRENAESNKINAIDQLVDFNWVLLLSYYHNISFPSLSFPSQGFKPNKYLQLVDSLKMVNIVNQLLKRLITNSLNNKFEIQILHQSNYLNTYAYNKNILASFSSYGGALETIINLQEGIPIIFTPASSFAIDEKSNEPIFGMFYDIIAQQYYKQFNTFRDYYATRYLNTIQGFGIKFSLYVLPNVLLEKTYKVDATGKEIVLDYNFKNTRAESEPFTLFTISNINLNFLKDHPIRKDDVVNTEINEGEWTKIKFEEKLTKNKLTIKIPKGIQRATSTGFKAKILTLRIDVPPLKEKETFNTTIKISF